MINQEIEQIERYYNIIREYLVTYSFQLLAAIAIFLLGLWLSKKALESHRKIDAEAQHRSCTYQLCGQCYQSLDNRHVRSNFSW